MRLLKEFKWLLSCDSDIGISEIKNLHNIEVFLNHNKTIYYLRVIFPEEYPYEQPKIYF